MTSAAKDHGPTRSDAAAATIVSKSSLSLARVLADSFRRQHPDVPFFVALADEVDGYFDPAAEPFALIRLRELQLPALAGFVRRYSQQELTYACTPYLLAHLLDRGFSRVAFFKQESLVTGDLTPELELLREHCIVLTPHLLEPLASDDQLEREAVILQSGVFNVGFLGISESAEARRFLLWWQDRLCEHCRHDVPSGIHFEQRWLDLVPSFFEGVAMVRDPGFNVAHWNLPDRTVRTDGDAITVDGRPCRFVRFSGFDPRRPERPTRYFARLSMEALGDAAILFRRYNELLHAAGWQETSRWPYAYRRRSVMLRTLMRRLRPMLRARQLAGRIYRTVRE